MIYQKIVTFNIEQTKNKEFNGGNYFGYTNWEYHVDKGKYPCYNYLNTVIYFDCKPDNKLRLTRSMANEILQDKQVQLFIYQTIYEFLKNEENDKPTQFAYPYPNEEKVKLTIGNSVEGNRIRFDISAQHFNHRDELIDAYIKKVTDLGIIL